MNRKISYGDKVFLATHSVDMRKQINGLAAVVQGVFGADLFDGSMFVFCNNDRTIVKILAWDIDGFVLKCQYWHLSTYAHVPEMPRIP